MCILYVRVCVVHRGLAAGIYATNNPEACHFVADNCKANIIVVENQKQLDKILEVSVAVTETYFCTSQVECRGLPMSVCLHDYQCLSVCNQYLCVCQLMCLALLLLCRSETVSLTWRPLCSTKESSAKSTPMSMRWLPYTHHMHAQRHTHASTCMHAHICTHTHTHASFLSSFLAGHHANDSIMQS